MDSSKHTETFIEEFINNTLGQAKQRRETQDRRENLKDELEQIDGSHKENYRGEEVNRKKGTYMNPKG